MTRKVRANYITRCKFINSSSIYFLLSSSSIMCKACVKFSDGMLFARACGRKAISIDQTSTQAGGPLVGTVTTVVTGGQLVLLD
jgi:hypothetical protein